MSRLIFPISYLNCLALLRFANMLQVSNMKIQTIWNAVKKRKLEKIDDKCESDQWASDYNGEREIIEKELHLQSSSIVFQNVTDAKLSTAVQMFLYLSTCSDILQPWLKFYSDLFDKESLDHIILSLNRLLKVDKSPRTNGYKKIAREIMKKITVMFSLKYQEIRNLRTKGKAQCSKLNL